jgi:hypothetical protein
VTRVLRGPGGNVASQSARAAEIQPATVEAVVAGQLTQSSVVSTAPVTFGDGYTTVVASPAADVDYQVLDGQVLTPTLSSSTSFNDVMAGNDKSQAYMNYQFQVLGPPGMIVPLFVFTSAGTSAGGGGGTNYCLNQELQFEASASAGLILTTDTGQVLNFLSGYTAAVTPGPNCQYSSGPITTFPAGTAPFPGGDVPVDVTSDQPESLQLYASSSASIDVGIGLGDAFASAGVDPYVQIDPTFPLANEFSLEFSPFIANELTLATEVPEPSTLVLVAGAFISLATVKWWRRLDAQSARVQPAERAASATPRSAMHLQEP